MMAYIESDLKRDLLLACNKARADMTIEEIQSALDDISNVIESVQNPPIAPPAELMPDQGLIFNIAGSGKTAA